MPDRVKVTITGYYNLPGDPEFRERVFGTADTAGCLVVDARGDPVDLLAYCQNVEMRLELVPDPDSGRVTPAGGEEQQ